MAPCSWLLLSVHCSMVPNLWAVEKCPRWNFYTPRKTRNSKNKSGYSIVGHPVIDNHFLKLDFFILIIFSLQKFFTKIFLDNLLYSNFTGTEMYSIYPILLTPDFLWTLKVCQPKIFEPTFSVPQFFLDIFITRTTVIPGHPTHPKYFLV